MSYSNSKLLRDKNGEPIPQYLDPETGEFTPLTGELKVRGSRSILAGEPFPDGRQDDSLLVYDEETKMSRVYKFISGKWRELL